MYEFKYDIKLNNNGRPYIDLPDDFSDDPEHRFMILEITQFMLYDLLDKYEGTDMENNNFIHELSFCARTLSDLSDQVAILIKDGMDAMDEINDILDENKTDDED